MNGKDLKHQAYNMTEDIKALVIIQMNIQVLGSGNLNGS
jgi:hypothetical protein